MRQLRFHATGISLVAVLVVSSSVPCAAQSWHQLMPTGTPPTPTGDQNAVFDSATSQMLVFDGAGYSPLNGLYSLRLIPDVWSPLTPSGRPPSARDFSTATYDSGNSRITIFGGFCPDFSEDAVLPLCENNDVWVLSNANGKAGTPAWTQLSPAGIPPSGRHQHTAVYDGGSNRMIVFGGAMFDANGNESCTNDTWILSNANGIGGAPNWIPIFPAGGPPLERFGHTAIYDPGSNRMIVFGGSTCTSNSSSFANDVWVLTNANGLGGTPSWIQLSPSGTPPAQRSGHTAVYDVAANSMIVFAGEDNFRQYNDVWTLSNANGLGGTSTWTKLNPAGTAPNPRANQSAIYDPATRRMTILGGIAYGLSDAWVLSLNNGESPTVQLETPLPNQSVSGMVTLAGWALPTSGTHIAKLQITVDGNAVYTSAAYPPSPLTVSRPDICARPENITVTDCPVVGFTAQWDTRIPSPSGIHTVCAVVFGTDFSTNPLDSNSSCEQVSVSPSKSAAITSPTPGSTMSGPTATFTWDASPSATEYWLDVGTAPYIGNIFGGSVGQNASKSVTGLPVDGSTIYVSLYTAIGGSYHDSSGMYLRNSYSYTAVKIASITAPAANSTLSTTATFSWSAVPVATEYWLDVGTAPYVGDIFGGSVGLATSKLVTGLPVDGSAVYATIYTKINGSFQDGNGTYLRNSSIYRAMKVATIGSPVPGSTLSSPTATFTWSAVQGATEYWLDVGTVPYVGNIFGGSVGAVTSKLVTGLPLDGSTVYATLYTKLNGSYQDSTGAYLRNSASYTAIKGAVISSPLPGSTLSGFTATFTWTLANGATAYWLDVGTAPYVGDIFGGNVGLATSQQVTGLPTDGSKVYASLYSFIGGAWARNSYTYTASTGPDPRATMITPTPGATLSGSSATFTWTSGTGVTMYWLDVGTAPYVGNIFGGNVGTATSRLVTGLPANGTTVYVSLYSNINGIWFRSSYTYNTGP